MSYLYPVISFLVSALVTFLSMPWLLRFCQRRGLYDIPNERKVHHNRIPRLGGVLFMPCAMIGLAAVLVLSMLFDQPVANFTPSSYLILTGVVLIYLIGLLDDILGLSAKVKFIIQFIASLFLPLCNLYINNLYGLFGIYGIPVWMGYFLTIFCCLLIVNSINLIDGIDGLASGLSLIALSVFTVMFYCLGAYHYAVFSMGLIGTVLVFFYFNMFGKVEKCTKTFMGDTGSLILGYGLSYLFFKTAMDNDSVLPYRPEALLVGASLLIIPTFDLVRVALMRLKHGVAIFHADKTHLHHKFLAAGFTMHQALVAILGLQVAFMALNLILAYCGLGITPVFLLDLVLFTLLQIALSRFIDRRKQS